MFNSIPPIPLSFSLFFEKQFTWLSSHLSTYPPALSNFLHLLRLLPTSLHLLLHLHFLSTPEVFMTLTSGSYPPALPHICPTFILYLHPKPRICEQSPYCTTFSLTPLFLSSYLSSLLFDIPAIELFKPTVIHPLTPHIQLRISFSSEPYLFVITLSFFFKSIDLFIFRL